MHDGSLPHIPLEKIEKVQSYVARIVTAHIGLLTAKLRKNSTVTAKLRKLVSVIRSSVEFVDPSSIFLPYSSAIN